MMRLFCLLCSWLLISCHSKPANRAGIQHDSSVFTIIPCDSNLEYVFDNAQPTLLEKEDLSLIDSLLITSIEQYNTEQDDEYQRLKTKSLSVGIDRQNFVIDIERYKRQYVACVDSNGDKIVWVNCVCDVTDTFWKHIIVDVSDGGNCYFNVKLNLAKRTWFDLYVNGES